MDIGEVADWLGNGLRDSVEDYAADAIIGSLLLAVAAASWVFSVVYWIWVIFGILGSIKIAMAVLRFLGIID